MPSGSVPLTVFTLLLKHAERLQDPWAPKINTFGECRVRVLVHNGVKVSLVSP